MFPSSTEPVSVKSLSYGMAVAIHPSLISVTTCPRSSEATRAVTSTRHNSLIWSSAPFSRRGPEGPQSDYCCCLLPTPCPWSRPSHGLILSAISVIFLQENLSMPVPCVENTTNREPTLRPASLLWSPPMPTPPALPPLTEPHSPPHTTLPSRGFGSCFRTCPVLDLERPYPSPSTAASIRTFHTSHRGHLCRAGGAGPLSSERGSLPHSPALVFLHGPGFAWPPPLWPRG